MKRLIAYMLVFCLLVSSTGLSFTGGFASAVAEGETGGETLPGEDEIPPAEGGETPTPPAEDVPEEGEDDEDEGGDPPTPPAEDVPEEGEDDEDEGGDIPTPPAEDVPEEGEDDKDEGGDPPTPPAEDVPEEGENDEDEGGDPPTPPAEDVPEEGEDDEDEGSDPPTPPAEDDPYEGEDDEDEGGDTPTPPAGDVPEEDEPEITVTGDVYMEVGGVRTYGDIEEMIPYGLEGHTLYLFHTLLIEIETEKIDGYDFNHIKEHVTFVPSPDEGIEGFDSRTVVHYSEIGSYGQDDYGIDYLWAGRPKEVIPEEPEEEEEEKEEIVVTEWELQVQGYNYTPDEPCEPIFTLIPSPDLQDGMYFAVSLNGGTQTVLSGDIYEPAYSGEYQFFLYDKNDKLLVQSARKNVLLPEVDQEWLGGIEEEDEINWVIHVDYPSEDAEIAVVSLSSSPALTDGMSFAVSINGEWKALSGSQYELLQSASYQFGLLNAEGEFLARSDVRDVEIILPDTSWLDGVEEDDGKDEPIQWTMTASLSEDSDGMPVVMLSASPDLQDGMTFAVSIDGSALQTISGSSYHPESDGVYHFALLDTNSVDVAWSEWVQVTMPKEEIEWTLGVQMSESELGLPLISLSASSDMTEDMTFAVSFEGSDWVTFPGNQWEVTMSGTYRFALLNAEGSAVASTEAAMLEVIQPGIGGMDLDDDEPDEISWKLNADLAYSELGIPCFTLTASPEMAEGMTYAVSFDGSEWIALSENRFEVTMSGSYQFALRDAQMNLLASTDIQPVEIAAADVSGAMTADLDEEMLVETTPEDGEIPPDPEDEPEETDGPAYYLNDQNEKVYGTLEELLHSDAEILYIETTRVIAISSSYASALAAKKLSPASYGYSFVNVSAVSPETNVESSSSLFVWQAVSKPVTAEEAPVLNVLYSNLKESDWVNTAPTFTLTITPATGLFNTYSYAVRVDDGSLRLLGEAASNGASAQTATFAPATQGKHTYQFVLVNQSGEAVAESKAFTIWLDTDAPEFRVSNTATYAMVVSVEDYASGGEYISLDGGKTWHKLTDKGSGASLYSATATQNTTFKAGSIVVRDKAGNTAKNQLDFTLYAMTAMGGMNAAGMSGLSGMSGSYRGGSGRTVYHSESDVEDVIAYNALRLSVHDEGMTRLKIGDEQLDLELSRNSSPAADASQPSPTFTAEFAAWDGGESKDTLILTVNDDVTDENGYTWSFTGAVYKKLAASGIDYMLLRVGDSVTAISTSGFTAGIRYNMYRAEGLASKEFQYDVRMGILMPSFEMDCTVSGTTYAMSEDTQSEMYYYDVYTGTADQFRSLARTEG